MKWYPEVIPSHWGPFIVSKECSYCGKAAVMKVRVHSLRRIWGYREVTCFPFKQFQQSFLKSLAAAWQVARTRTYPPPRLRSTQERQQLPLIVLRSSQGDFTAPPLSPGHVLALPIVRMNLHQFIHPQPWSAPCPVTSGRHLENVWLLATATEKSKALLELGLDQARPVLDGQRRRRPGTCHNAIPSTWQSLWAHITRNHSLAVHRLNQPHRYDLFWPERGSFLF